MANEVLKGTIGRKTYGGPAGRAGGPAVTRG
jgi:hypothetical protein